MKVLVTGAAGFIGATLYMYLVDRGYEVIGVDSFERPSRMLLPFLDGKSLHVARLDVLDRRKLRQYMEGIDAVVHLAAYIEVAESNRDPLKYINNNVLGTASVLEACREAGVKKFVYISSAAVYGEPLELPVGESHPTKPLSPYGYSKLLGEYLARMYSEVYGLDVVVLRLFNVYGYGQSGEYAGVISKFIERVSMGKSPIIFGDGEQTRDFIYVDDVCRAIELSLIHNTDFDIFNVATGRRISINELAHLIIREAGLDLEPVYAPPREGDIKHSYADVSHAAEKLGFKAEVGLGEGIRLLMRRHRFRFL